MTKITLFLSSLPEEATDQGMAALLSCYARLDKVKLKMIQGGASCAGYGFAELQDPQAAHFLVSLSDTLAFQGTRISIQINQPGVTLNEYKTSLELRKVYLLGIPEGANPETIRQELSSAGLVERVYTINNKRNIKSQNYGYAIFRSKDSAQKAIKIRKFRVGSEQLIVKPFVSVKQQLKSRRQDLVPIPMAHPMLSVHNQIHFPSQLAPLAQRGDAQPQAHPITQTHRPYLLPYTQSQPSSGYYSPFRGASFPTSQPYSLTRPTNWVSENLTAKVPSSSIAKPTVMESEGPRNSLDLKMFVQVDLEDQLPDDGAHDEEEGSVTSEISTETKCCIFAKVVKNAPEGMLPPFDPWDIEALIENSMMNARQVID